MNLPICMLEKCEDYDFPLVGDPCILQSNLHFFTAITTYSIVIIHIFYVHVVIIKGFAYLNVTTSFLTIDIPTFGRRGP